MAKAADEEGAVEAGEVKHHDAGGPVDADELCVGLEGIRQGAERPRLMVRFEGLALRSGECR